MEHLNLYINPASDLFDLAAEENEGLHRLEK